MSDIRLQSVKAQIGRWFRATGGSRQFSEDFLTACNMTIARINRQADLESRIPKITNEEATAVGLDDEYLDVFLDLVAINMKHLGARVDKGTEVRLAVAERNMDDRIDSIRQDILNVSQEADSDDDTTDNVGLGALG